MESAAESLKQRGEPVGAGGMWWWPVDYQRYACGRDPLGKTGTATDLFLTELKHTRTRLATVIRPRVFLIECPGLG